MKIEIDALEARTRLSELLRQVKAGKRFTITYRGEAVADLVPSSSVRAKNKSTGVEHAASARAAKGPCMTLPATCSGRTVRARSRATHRRESSV